MEDDLILKIDEVNDNVTILTDKDTILSYGDNIDLLDDNEALTLKSVSVSNERITPSDTNGFKSQLLTVLGDYEMVVTDYTYSNTQGYTQHSIDVSPDYVWLSTALFALIGVYSVFRIIGMFFGGKR